jgi:hypothetical protein
MTPQTKSNSSTMFFCTFMRRFNDASMGVTCATLRLPPAAAAEAAGAFGRTGEPANAAAFDDMVRSDTASEQGGFYRLLEHSLGSIDEQLS